MSSFKECDTFTRLYVKPEQVTATTSDFNLSNLPASDPSAPGADELVRVGSKPESWDDVLCLYLSTTEMADIHGLLFPDAQHILIEVKGYLLVAVWGPMREYLPHWQLQIISCGQLYETLSDEDKSLYQENAFAGIAQHAFLGDWYRSQHGRSMFWIEFPRLVNNVLALQPAHAEEVARKLVFIALYLSEDSLYDSCLQNSDYQGIICSMLLSLRHCITTENNLQLIAIIHQVIWPGKHDYIEAYRHLAPQENLNLLAECLSISRERHPIWINPETFEQKLSSTRVFQGHTEKISEIRRILANDNLVLSPLDPHLAWHLSKSQTTEFPNILRYIQCPGEYIRALSIFSLFNNLYLSPEVISILEDPDELEWSCDQVLNPHPQNQNPFQTILLCLLGLWAYKNRTINLQKLHPLPRGNHPRDVLYHFDMMLKGKGQKPICVGTLSQMIRGLDMVLRSQQSDLAILTTQVLILSRKFLPSELDPRAECYWVMRIKRPDLLHDSVIGQVRDEFERGSYIYHQG